MTYAEEVSYQRRLAEFLVPLKCKKAALDVHGWLYFSSMKTAVGYGLSSNSVTGGLNISLRRDFVSAITY